MLVLEQIQKEEKTYFDQKKVELIVEKTGEIKVSEDVKWTELKQDIDEKRDISVHETEISWAEDASIKGVELSKETGLEKDVAKAALVVTEEKDVLVHETEISVGSIPVQKRKEETIFKSRKCKRKLEDLQLVWNILIFITPI